MNLSSRWARALIPALFLMGAACSSKGGGEGEAGETAAKTAAAKAGQSAGAAQISEAAMKEAEEIFKSRCTPCHGEKGDGKGPTSAALQPPPRDFTSPEWQKSVTDEHIEKIIRFGGGAVGRSVAMPANPDLGGKPEVLTALRQYIRNLAR